MHPALLVVALTLFMGVSLAACDRTVQGDLDNAELKALIAQGVPIYDIRRPEEWRQTGVIEGSRLLTWVDSGGRLNPGFFSEISAAIGKDEPVILICRTGSRTGRLARELASEHGFSRVYNVEDGILRWIAEGNRVIK